MDLGKGGLDEVSLFARASRLAIDAKSCGKTCGLPGGAGAARQGGARDRGVQRSWARIVMNCIERGCFRSGSNREMSTPKAGKVREMERFPQFMITGQLQIGGFWAGREGLSGGIS